MNRKLTFALTTFVFVGAMLMNETGAFGQDPVDPVVYEKCVPGAGTLPSGRTCTRDCRPAACPNRVGCVIYSDGACVETPQEHTCSTGDASIVNFISTCKATECEDPTQFECDWVITGGQCGVQNDLTVCTGT